MKSILVSFAHPDDESFFCGLTIPKYRASGWTVRLICATYGEQGSHGPYEHITGQAVGAVRRTELERAAEVLGINEIVPLDYPDGGLHDLGSGELEDVLYKKMVAISPDIVITFDPKGISNHPDHIRMSYSTTYAFQRYMRDILDTREYVTGVKVRDPDVKKRHFAMKHRYPLSQEQFAEIAMSRQEPKLYYACLPESVVRYRQKLQLMPREAFGKRLTGTPDKAVTTVISGDRYKSVKEKALRQHITQTADVERYLRTADADFASKEFFMLRMIGLTEVIMGKNDAIKNRLQMRSISPLAMVRTIR